MLDREQNTRAGGARGGCGGRTGRLASCAHRGLPVTPTPAVSFPKRPQLLSRKINHLERPPADKACVYAASAPVTGVAWRRARRGLRDLDISAAALRRHPGADVGEGERRKDLRPPPLSGPPLSLSRGSGGRPQSAGRWVGSGGGYSRPQGREGEGRGNAKSWGLQGAGATSPGRGRDARPRPQEHGHSPGDRWTPPQTAAPRGCLNCGIRGPLGLSGWICGAGAGVRWPRLNPGGSGAGVTSDLSSPSWSQLAKGHCQGHLAHQPPF